MTERILEAGEGVARLHVRLSQLVIERAGLPDVITPVEELAALVIPHPRVLLTQAVLSRLAVAGAAVVICDEKYTPVAMMLPVQTHSTQTERLARQIHLGEPRRKRLWQEIVRAKVGAQSRLLAELHGNDGGLAGLSSRVRSGDPENVEAQAARIYWPRLFKDPGFRRTREGADQNRHLNYGYTVLRAVVARAVCAVGLHPSLGLQHHNRYDPFSLAADVMEPFRPMVDRSVAQWVREHDPMAPLDREAKARLLGPLLGRYEVDGEVRTFFDICARTASSLLGVIMGERSRMEIPEKPEPVEPE